MHSRQANDAVASEQSIFSKQNHDYIIFKIVFRAAVNTYVSLPIFRGLDARGGKNYERAHTHTWDNHSKDNNNKIHIDRILERRPTHRPGKCSSIANFTLIGSSKVDTSTIDLRSSTHRREKAETSHRQRHRISTRTCA